jgi:biotin operon repressor
MSKKHYTELAAVIERPQKRIVLHDELSEEWTVAWIKLSTAFKPHIKRLRGAPLAVWLYISLSIDADGNAFPGIRTIADETGYSHQAVIDAIKYLEEQGYLSVKRGERRYNIYKPEFAAIGKTNEPTETVKKLDSSETTNQVSTSDESSGVDSSEQKSQLLQPDESSFSPKESSGVDLNKINQINQNPAKTDFPEQQKRGDLVDAYLDFMHSPGLKRQVRIDAILSYLSVQFGVNTETKRWQEFAKFVDNRQQNHGESVEVFVKWLKSQPGFDMSFWSPQRMAEHWPRAFVAQPQQQQYAPVPERKGVPRPPHLVPNIRRS